MKLSHFLAVWCTALCLIAAAIFVTIARQDSAAVFVGSSLTDHAIPPDDDRIAALLGGSYVKNGHRGVRRQTFIRELDFARSAGAKVVLIEVTHFLYDQARVPEQKGWFASGWYPLHNFGERLLADTRVIGREALTQAGILGDYTNRSIRRKYKLDPKVLDQLFPIKPGRSRELQGLSVAIERLQSEGAEVILMVPPVSEVAFELAGDGALEEVARLARDYADETGAALFIPRAPWPNSFYIDSSHLNVAGRARLSDELVQWLSDKRSASVDG